MSARHAPDAPEIAKSYKRAGGAGHGRLTPGRLLLTAWHERVVPIEALAMGGTTLVGMELLRGSELRIQATSGGRVEIEESP